MKEIKYRGKRVDNGEWVEGHFFETVEGIRRCYNIVVNREVKFYVRYDTIGQFIGLKDKKGKEIFEGDIIKSDSHSNPSEFAIEFIEGGFCATHPTINDNPIDINHFYPSIGCTIEVIGNKFDNPELLKEV